jgi:5-methylthioribose kinase
MQKILSESNIFEYLRERYPTALGAGARCEPAGDGNINWVRRIRSEAGSVIVKQAGPCLQKFPEYAVTPDRILHEARYYRAVAPFDPDGVCPRVLTLDADHRVLVLEDLGECERLDAALRRGADVTGALCRIAAFLGRVHERTRNQHDLANFPVGASDDGVLRLHFEHIFRLPFAPNDFPLSAALRAVARELAGDAAFRERVAAVETHCREGAALIHGDVQPTNILLARRGAVLLDAEIAHRGSPHFDVGLLLGHLVLAAVARGRAADAVERVAPVWQAYVVARGAGAAACDFREAAAIAGIEVLRRTLGAARVPEVADDAVALAAVRAGAQLLRERPHDPALLRGLG